MGQYKTYRNTYLDKEIAEIERELIAYKATQAYGASQIQSRIATLADPITATAVQVGSYTRYFIFGRITFLGVNKGKLARGALTWTPSATSSWYVCEASDEKETHEKKWYIYLSGQAGLTINVSAYMNMSGRLTYESLI